MLTFRFTFVKTCGRVRRYNVGDVAQRIEVAGYQPTTPR